MYKYFGHSVVYCHFALCLKNVEILKKKTLNHGIKSIKKCNIEFEYKT